jgi:hypothetical protein
MIIIPNCSEEPQLYSVAFEVAYIHMSTSKERGFAPVTIEAVNLEPFFTPVTLLPGWVIDCLSSMQL